MGLKTTNYTTQKTNQFMPNAYARIKDLVLNGNNGRAIFSIQSTREDMDKFDPVEKVEVRFTWDRKKDIAEAAYEAAKSETRTVEKIDPTTGEHVSVVKHGPLYGWTDDIV